MQFKYLILSALLVSCGLPDSSSPSQATSDSSQSMLADSGNQVKDHHTTSYDVVENLFLFINKKDWSRVREFYQSADDNFFRNLMKSEKVVQFEVLKISPEKDGLKVTTNARNADSSFRRMCFLFLVTENRVTQQAPIDCGPL